MSTMEQILADALADKAAHRRAARARSWPEKVATIQRLRDAGRLARRAMSARRATERRSSPEP